MLLPSHLLRNQGSTLIRVGQRLYLLRQIVLSHNNCPFAYLYHSVILSAIQLCTELCKASKDALEYLRKATLCSIRIVRKVLDLAENFMGLDASLLKEKHHGPVLISAIQLCTELCKASKDALEYLRKSWEKTVDCYSPGQGLMPTNFKIRTLPLDENNEGFDEVLDPDFGEAAIGRVAPMDSGLWWIILLRAYIKITGDNALLERVDVQTGIQLIQPLPSLDVGGTDYINTNSSMERFLSRVRKRYGNLVR